MWLKNNADTTIETVPSSARGICQNQEVYIRRLKKVTQKTCCQAFLGVL